MILPILKFPDKRLQTKAAKVEAVDDNIQKMIKNMFETMYAKYPPDYLLGF
jgi:peptide deformylase